jgi:hypothetical protein
VFEGPAVFEQESNNFKFLECARRARGGGGAHISVTEVYGMRALQFLARRAGFVRALWILTTQE